VREATCSAGCGIALTLSVASRVDLDFGSVVGQSGAQSCRRGAGLIDGCRTGGTSAIGSLDADSVSPDTEAHATGDCTAAMLSALGDVMLSALGGVPENPKQL